ncbi:MAG: hemerythrin domain-containing protein [Thermoplasmata archaeon]
MGLLDELKFKGSIATQLIRDQHINTVKTCEKFLNDNLNKKEFVEHIYFLLSIHFKIKEEILYPPFKQILEKYLPYAEPLKMVLAEHKGVKNLLYKFENINDGHDYLKDISELLLQDVYKEENGILNQIDLLMPEDMKKEVSEKIKNFIEK